MVIGEFLKVWYALSKTLAERAAWEFCNTNGIDLVTILPSFLVGPSLPRDLCSTASDVLGLLKGNFLLHYSLKSCKYRCKVTYYYRSIGAFIIWVNFTNTP